MGKRGTQMQAAVLSVLRQHERPLTAYEVLGALRQANPTLAPTTIYRALAALSEANHIHRLESLNAFIARKNSGDQAAILSICGDCGVVEESVAPDLLADLSRVAGQSGFAALRHVIEIHGRCATCSGGAAQI